MWCGTRRCRRFQITPGRLVPVELIVSTGTPEPETGTIHPCLTIKHSPRVAATVLAAPSGCARSRPGGTRLERGRDMRLTLWLLGHEVLSLELGSDTGPADEYAVLTGGVEVGPGDDGTR